MRTRFEVSRAGKWFASVHAATEDEAILIACRMPGHRPEVLRRRVRRAVPAGWRCSGRIRSCPKTH